jgi:hypothetical protein
MSERRAPRFANQRSKKQTTVMSERRAPRFANRRSKKKTTVMSERRAPRFQMLCLQIIVPNAHVVVFPQ